MTNPQENGRKRKRISSPIATSDTSKMNPSISSPHKKEKSVVEGASRFIENLEMNAVAISTIVSELLVQKETEETPKMTPKSASKVTPKAAPKPRARKKSTDVDTDTKVIDIPVDDTSTPEKEEIVVVPKAKPSKKFEDPIHENNPDRTLKRT